VIVNHFSTSIHCQAVLHLQWVAVKCRHCRRMCHLRLRLLARKGWHLRLCSPSTSRETRKMFVCYICVFCV